jgi:galactose mutarotase-like enzyme
MSDWYQLDNNRLIVQMTNKGAEIKRLFPKIWRRELLWQPNDEIAKAIWNRSAPVLFPIVGKLKEDKYHFQGKDYVLPQHGFARDMEFECVECDAHAIEFVLQATQESFAHYPFLFELRIRYELDEAKLKTTYSVKNLDRQDIYFSIGAHPGFNVLGHLEEYEIRFEQAEEAYYLLKEKLVNLKKPVPLNTKTIKLTKELFKDDALIFKDLKSTYVDLVNLKHNEIVRIHKGSAPYFGIWGKGDVPFVCLEPWWGIGDDTLHDGKLENKKGIVKLSEGKSKKFSFTIELV